MVDINSNSRVSNYLQKHDIKIDSDEVNKKLGEIFQIDKLTSNFPFSSYSKGAQEFIHTMDKQSKAYFTIEDGSIDQEDIAVIELEKDFVTFMRENNPYFGLIRNYQFFTELESFIEKH